jgi:hypothetical protein
MLQVGPVGISSEGGNLAPPKREESPGLPEGDALHEEPSANGPAWEIQGRVKRFPETCRVPSYPRVGEL